MQKATYELAISIPEPEPSYCNGGVRTKEFYTAQIDGKDITRSSRWWSMWHDATEGAKFGRCTVRQRISRGWDEDAACLARKKERQADYFKRSGKVEKVNKKGRSIADSYLLAAWV
jgi:hypothetical protein